MNILQKKTSIVVVGGGLAGLVSSIELAKAGVSVVLIEKNIYPFHRVCGEYISNEVKTYLTHLLGFSVDSLDASSIDRLQITDTNGQELVQVLDMGGFGLSRFVLDKALVEVAQKVGVDVWMNESVEEITRISEEEYLVKTKSGCQIAAVCVIGAHGKRSHLDRVLNRSFFKKRSEYVGVKYHISYSFPKNQISLHNFEGGYCGISAIEDDRYCLCYLVDKKQVQKAGGIKELEQRVLMKNKYLAHIFENATFLYDKPLVISEVSFRSKEKVVNGIIMVGDSAGLIAPLCGNGMAMAIKSGKIVSECMIPFINGQIGRPEMEGRFIKSWQNEFATRLFVGRKIQSLFGASQLTTGTLFILKHLPKMVHKLIGLTHGKEIKV
jgi:flavin-dependent dehydrogenase